MARSGRKIINFKTCLVSPMSRLPQGQFLLISFCFLFMGLTLCLCITTIFFFSIEN
jgi:hypothetical protein